MKALESQLEEAQTEKVGLLDLLDNQTNQVRLVEGENEKLVGQLTEARALADKVDYVLVDTATRFDVALMAYLIKRAGR